MGQHTKMVTKTNIEPIVQAKWMANSKRAFQVQKTDIVDRQMVKGPIFHKTRISQIMRLLNHSVVGKVNHGHQLMTHLRSIIRKAKKGKALEHN